MKENEHTQLAIYRGPHVRRGVQDPQWGRGRWKNTARGATVTTLPTRQSSTHCTTIMLLSMQSNTEPRVTSVPASPYAYSQSGTQTLNLSDQSQTNSIHPPDSLKLGQLYTSASHLANCKCKCTKNDMSPWRDIYTSTSPVHWFNIIIYRICINWQQLVHCQTLNINYRKVLF